MYICVIKHKTMYYRNHCFQLFGMLYLVFSRKKSHAESSYLAFTQNGFRDMESLAKIRSKALIMEAGKTVNLLCVTAKTGNSSN